jgi:uncharacterized membrane protein (DUF2068 family)
MRDTTPLPTGSRARSRPSLWRRIRDWAAWEFDRRIEVTLAIRLITFERFAKATILIVGGIALLVIGAKTNLHQATQDLQDQLNLSPGRGWWGHVYETVVTRFGNLSRTREAEVAVGAMLYGVLEALEGVGLLMRRRWAEYLVLIATGVFLPLEVVEIVSKPTVFKVGAFAVNVAIVVYLVWRKRLFLERPDNERADETEPVPADLLHGIH